MQFCVRVTQAYTGAAESPHQRRVGVSFRKTALYLPDMTTEQASPIPDRALHDAAALLRAAKRPVVLTGAGISRESGIPTFRDALDGLWAQYDPMQLATPQAFRRDPALVWRFYEFRRTLMRPALPNPGHHALAALEKRFPTLHIITQNVDDLHEQAGSTQVVRLHGRISASRCSGNCRGERTLIDPDSLPAEARSETPPRCPHCGAYLRPDVVWFNEMLPPDALNRAQMLSAQADIMLVVGTSGVVYPAAGLPSLTQRAGGHLIEINPQPSDLTPIMDVWLGGESGVVLPRLLDLIEKDDALDG